MTRIYSFEPRTRSGKTAAHRGCWSRLADFGVLAALIIGMPPGAASAQTAARPMPPAPALAAVPTVKLLAIGSFTAGATPGVWKPILPSEMRETARLYLSGRIDQWYVKQDQSGVVFILNITDPKKAQELLGQLPLGRAGLMRFQIIPLGPLSPLGLLLPKPARSSVSFSRLSQKGNDHVRR
jgi:hypothetical protein